MKTPPARQRDRVGKGGGYRGSFLRDNTGDGNQSGDWTRALTHFSDEKTEAQIVRANTYTNLLCTGHCSKQLVLILVLTALLLLRRKLQQKEVK